MGNTFAQSNEQSNIKDSEIVPSDVEKVQPSSKDSQTEVKFNVENVNIPSENLKSESIRSRIDQLAEGNLIDEGGSSTYYQTDDIPLIIDAHKHGFIAAITTAFKDHYPLSLRPQHFWLLILQGIAIHVDKNAEELRSKWVSHEGKKTLTVKCDEFGMGTPNNWASVVDGKKDSFSIQIDNNINSNIMKNLIPDFSDTSNIENIALKITVMDMTKNYFDFKCSTMCGFPSITLEGTKEDWLLLYNKAQVLINEQCTEEFANKWLVSLLPLLKKIYEQYISIQSNKKNSIDKMFWNSMCKKGGSMGSGSRTWFNGWFNILFPYIENSYNSYSFQPYSSSNGYVREGLVWDKRYSLYSMRSGGPSSSSKGGIPEGVKGPDILDFPDGIGKAPVKWNYNGKNVNLLFNAGFIGAHQDPETLIISPHIAWFITKEKKNKNEETTNSKFKFKGF